MGIGLLVSFVGVFVAGLAGVLGVWMERDSSGRMVWPLFFSAIILAATGVEMVHSVFQEVQESRTEAQMATLLEQLTTLSEHNPELQQYVAAELAVQERTNPGVVKKLERSVAAKGGDPNAVRQMAESGRRQQAAGGTPRPRPQQRPKAKSKAGADDEAKAGAAAAPAPEPAAAVAAAAASGDPDAAMAAAQAEADKMLADAQAEADAMKAEAEKVKKEADKALRQAEKLKKEAEAALKNIPGVGGGGGGKGGGGKGGGGGGIPKIPGK